MDVVHRIEALADEEITLKVYTTIGVFYDIIIELQLNDLSEMPHLVDSIRRIDGVTETISMVMFDPHTKEQT